MPTSPTERPRRAFLMHSWNRKQQVRGRLGSVCAAAAGLIASVCVVLGALPVAAHAQACPNEAFRIGPSANLPDCRAYEMVSPLEKNGGYIETGLFDASPEGESARFFSTAGFAGASSDLGTATAYRSSRAATGWETQAQTLPQGQYLDYHDIVVPDQVDYSYGNVDTSLEGGASLYLAQQSSQPEADRDFYLAESNGETIEVGPELPPTAAGLVQTSIAWQPFREGLGLSADASHVVFKDPQPAGPNQWSFGAPGALLEYNGTGNTQPLLVGVDDSGTHFVNNCPTQYLGGVTGTFNGVNNPISSDGSRIFFTDGCHEELFARLNNGLPDARTIAISEPTTGPAGDCFACDTEPAVQEGAEFIGASEDGAKVFFYTSQPLLNGSGGLYEYDFEAPTGQKVTQIASGFTPYLQTDAATARVQISQDGSHVYFLSRSVLTDEASPDAQGNDREGNPVATGAVAQPEGLNLYVYEQDSRYPDGHISYVGTLAESERRSELQANLTPDGRFLLLGIETELTSDDTSTSRQLFEYDAQTGGLARVSIGEHGYNNDGNGPDNVIINERGRNQEETGFTPSSYSDHLSISADGSYVFFQSADGLTPGALNNVPVGDGEEDANNIYEYHDGNVYLISDGQDTTSHDVHSQVELLTTDLSGRDVFFTSADPLVPQDTDTNKDVYDARIDGGFAPPPAPASCSEDACQGPLSGAPVLLSPGSEAQAGGDNLPPTIKRPAVKRKAKAKPKRKASSKKRQAKPKRHKKSKQARRAAVSTRSEQGGRQ